MHQGRIRHLPGLGRGVLTFCELVIDFYGASPQSRNDLLPNRRNGGAGGDLINHAP